MINSIDSKQHGYINVLINFLIEVYLNDRLLNFYSIMFTCGDKTSKFYVGKITSSLLKKVFQLYYVD